MVRYIIILNVFAAFCAYSGAGPRYPATKGEVWPRPQHQVKKDTVLTYDHRRFQIKITGVTCPLLSSIAARYSHIFARQSQLALREHAPAHKLADRLAILAELQVQLTGPCEKYPHLGMDESCAVSLLLASDMLFRILLEGKVEASLDDPVLEHALLLHCPGQDNLTIDTLSTLKSGSVWGVLRGFQTVLHSFYFSHDYKEILINETEIYDYPRYSHRGLLIDTGRHYLSMQNILLLLDAMEMNKMNVLHWHMVDDQSFPYQSKKFPELSEHGAYYPTMVYSKADIVLVVKYARERGIRVVPEFDVPGHTLSWAESHPEIVMKCYDDNFKQTRAVLNPILNATYDLLGDLIKEVQDLFPDKYFHVGGDEVLMECWESDPTIKAYLKKHNMHVGDLFTMFIDKLFGLLGSRSKPIVWQEVFQNMPSLLPASTPVQIWLSDPIEGNEEYSDNGKKNVNRVLTAGKKVILSAPWYLDHLDRSWVDYYNHTDPRAMVVKENEALVDNVLGGEACMWGEMVDDRNVISRVWPRASATAEVLWSSPPFDVSMHSVNKNRLEEHTCRMIRHDIGAQPASGPGFCVANPNHL